MDPRGLLRVSGREDGPDDETMVLSLVFLYALGPTLFLTSMAAGGTPAAGPAVYGLTAAAYAVFAALAVVGRRLPRWAAEGAAYALVLAGFDAAFPVDRWLMVVGTLVAICAVVSFIRTRLRRREDRLRHYALHDPLTGLANRTLFSDRLGHAMALADRRSRALAVLYADLDGFKRVNDEMGHEAGDQLLAAVAERMRGCVRPSETVARVGGDEFAVLLEDVEPGAAEAVAQRMLDSLASPFVVGTRSVSVGASVGVADADGGEVDPDDRIRRADRAMYAAKQAGGGTVGRAPS